jgi:hypothetical protein
MGADESALLRLWQEKRGELEPEDLSGNLIVQLGLVTEALNRNWYERDEFTVPLCRIHHRELHRQGDEAAWWGKLSIDPVPVALKLWQHTRLNGTAFPPSGGAELGLATATQDPGQGPAGTNLDPGIDAGSSAKNADGCTSQ